MAQSAQRATDMAKVVIIGTTGAGKSMLADLLVFGRYEKGDDGEPWFDVGDGHEAETQELKSLTRSEAGIPVLEVTDTPGIPDTDRKKSLKHYDTIITHVREAPWINAIIIMVDDKRIHVNQYEEMRALMKQFNTLPCAKIMVYRMLLPPGCSASFRERKDAGAEGAMHSLCEKAGLPFVMKTVLHNVDSAEVQRLRDLICERPRVPQAGLRLRTFEEIKTDLEHLSNESKRIEALGRELERLSDLKNANDAVVQKLNKRLEKQEQIEEGVGEIVGLFSAKAADYVVSLSQKLTGFREAKRIADARAIELSEDIEGNEAEVREGQVDPEALKHAKKEYQELEILGSG